MGLNLSGSWQQGHSATYNTPSRGPRGSSTARAWPTARASGAKRPLLQVGNRTAGARVASSPDSDLEAFSHNPTHGSFAPLAFQPSAMTNCANQRFLSRHDGLNPAHVPYWWVNNPTLGEFCFTMIGRADIEGSKSNVAMNAWLPQASYPCGNFSDTSSFKFRRSKGSIGHAFTVRIRTGNQNQTSFYPFVPHEISVLVELILGHLRYLLTDVPPQPNSPPDNVFRPDRPPKRPWVQKEGQRPASDSRNNRIPLVRTSSESTVRRPGKAPERAVPSPSPAGTRRPALAAGAARAVHRQPTVRTRPSPQSQSFSRGYGSILPTSLAYIVPSTRGCSPWRPDAVMSTTGRGRHSVLRIFKGRRGRTGHHATCGALPAAGPYLRLSRFQGILTRFPFEARARTRCRTGFPRLLGSTNPCASAVHMEPFPSSAFMNICYYHQDLHRRPLRPGSRPGFAATAAPSYSSGPGACPDGRVSAQLGTVTRLPVHPASPVLLTKNGPLGALDSVARLNEAAAPSYLFKSFAPIPKSDERFARQYRCGPPPEFPLASPRSGIVHHLSGPDRHALTRTLLRRSRSVGGATLEGIPPVSFLAPYGFTRPRDEWGAHRPMPGARMCGARRDGARCSPRSQRRHLHRRFKGPGLGRHRDPHRSTPRADRGPASPFHIRPGRIAGPHPLPSRQFQALFDSLFKVLFIFPSRYLFAIGLSPIFSLGRNLPPDWGCIPKQPDSQTAPRGAAGSSHDGALTLSGAPFQGTWAWSAAEDASPDYNSNAAGARFSSWAFPGSLAVTRGILSRLTWVATRASLKANARVGGPGATSTRTTVSRVSQPPLVVATAAEDSILGQPRAGARGRPVSAPALVSRGEWGRRCVTPRQTCPRPGGLGRNLRSKTRWFTGFCNSHQVSHFATFFIDARAEISVAESRSDYHKKKARPRHRGYEGGLLVLNFLGASRAGVRWRAVSGQMRPSTAREDTRAVPEPSLSCHGFAGRSAGAGFDNDPSAGSPTETLLRLLLPLNDKVQWTSRDVASGEPPTSPRSEHFTGPFNR
uniref:Senescence-associated protein n=1 Tax=Salix viminalis TaxID=40686 RepID=A0A6N2MN31_SALVM